MDSLTKNGDFNYDRRKTIPDGVDAELQNWKNISKNCHEADERRRANAFIRAIEPIVQEMNSLETVRLREMEDSANGILGCIDDLWKLDNYHYPQDEMDRLLGISSACFAEAIAKKLKSASIWKQKPTESHFYLTQALAGCNAWIDECNRMTSLFWKNDMYHPWKGQPFQSLTLLKLRDRINNISSILQVVRLAAQLISPSKRNLLEPSYLFESFQALDESAEPNSLLDSAAWKTAVTHFNEHFTQAEQEAGVALRPRLISAGDDPSVLLDSLLEYKELVQRPRIRRELESEGQALMNYTKSWLQKLRLALGSAKVSSSNSSSEVSDTIREIHTIRQLETQVSKIQKGVQIFVNDMEEAGGLDREARALLSEIQDQINEIFDSWSRNVLAGIRDESLSLSSDTPVMSFDHNKLMKINYDSRLIEFVKEVRELSAMGFKIAPQILRNSKLAEDFMQQAKDLEEIATFHNNIGDSMLPCLKPLMLEAAMGLSALVQEHNVVTWTQGDSVNNYIRRLQQAVQRLNGLNQQLTMCHEQIQEKVLRLFDVDLLTQQQKWKDALREIRLIMGTVEAQGFKNSYAWRLYWDYQLYKAVECQYLLHLDDLHNDISDIHVELDFKKQNFQFKPPIEEIRREYYGRLRKFMSLPLHFKGFVDQPGHPSIFPKMIEKHGGRFGQVFAASGKLFVELDKFKEQFKIWVIPALVDLDTLFERKLSEPQDWDVAFQAAKKRKEELSTLSSDDERVGCIVINLTPLHREIEYIHRRYWDALTSSLYTSIHKDATSIDNFISNATAILTVKSHDIDEFSQTSGDFNELLRTTPEMDRLMIKAEAKAQVLSRWTQDSVEIYNQVCLKWKDFNTLLSRHKDQIHQQLDNLKSNTQSQIIQFTSQIDQFYHRWQKERQSDKFLQSDGKNFDQYLAILQSSRGDWDGLMQSQSRLNSNLERVGEKPVELSLVAEIEQDIIQQERIWSLYQSFIGELDEMGQEEWIVFRNKIAKLDEFLETWLNRLNENEDQQLPIVMWLKNEIELDKLFIPVLKLSRGETFTERHWTEFFRMAGMSSTTVERIVFRDLLRARSNLTQNFNELKELNGRAAGESLVRQALAELEQWEIESRWTLAQHVDSNGIQLFIIKEFKELLNKVGENMSLIQSVKDSSYYQTYSDRIMLWESKMTDLDFYLRHLSQIQIKWLYLEPVFNRGALLKDAGRFRRLDADFRFIITEIKRDSRVTSILRVSNLRSLVTSLLDQVGRCQKSLFEFLEDKRSKFARFYFLGDEDLLDIVGQAATRPGVIQPHLKKLFAGIHSVLFSNDQRHIVAVASLEGERVELKSPISVASEEVEIWLNRLVSETRNTLQSMLRDCVQERQRDAADLSRFPTQILCLAEAIVFTERCEKAISSGGLSKLKSDYQNQLASYTSAPLLQSSGSDEQGVIVLKLQALIMDIIHYIDVIQQVTEARCRSPTDWAWQKQLRFYLKSGRAVAQMASTEIEYTYEYQGNVAKLVHTPLTDKCYLTLTLALRMGLGGNPYGPAGTGKTESVKALGSLLGRQVLVFNCDEGLDVKSMGRIFVGLAKSGAWGCFDEFNRLDENTLSTVSTLIQAIQLSLKNKNNTVSLLGAQVDISPHTGIFVTLNPAGKEYGGRQKLPDNLKLLFRPVVMSEPDIELIAEVILYSQGFRDAQIIGKKLVDIFRLAQKLLSRQQHYDWGLRALKSVLRTAGDGLRASLATGNLDDVEYTAVVRALNFNTLSKLTTADSTLFLGLVADMFPTVQQNSDNAHAALVDVIAACCKDMGLIPLDRQLKKILEVYEQAKQRMGVVIVGPPQTGKSTVCAILKKVLQQQKRKVQTYTMNPKAISRIHLLGLIDPATREWTDGVLTKVARLIVSETEVISWVVCDGDIDPEWIEALNSVLDDNRLLTMASGERIKFGPDVNFIFETHDLTYASPATISRMGVVFFSEEDMEFSIVIRRWLLEQPNEVQKFLQSLIDNYLYKVIEWISKNGESVVNVSTLTMIRGILSHMLSCQSKTQLVNGLLKGGGANLTAASRNSFGQMVLSMCGEKTPDSENPFLCNYDPKADALVNPNPNDFESAHLIESDDEDQLLVPTTNLQVAYGMIQPWLTSKDHVLLVGPEACGKSLLMKHCLRQLRSTRVITFACTASTTPQDVLQKLLQNSVIVSSSSGQTLCPREASMLVLYLKDLNIVVPDKWGTCQLIAFLEQVINYKGCYDHNGEWLIMDNIQLACTLNLNHSQGRFQPSPRFTSLMRVAAISEPQLRELEILTSNYLSLNLKEKAATAERFLKKIAAFMVHFDGEMKRNVIPTNNFQILFTTRHLTSWAEGLARYEIRWDDLNAVASALGYEACRIYRDKLVSDEQRIQFDGLSNQLFNDEWKISPQSSNGLIYTSYRSKKQGLIPVSLSDWEKIIFKTLQQYGRENEPLDVEMLPELLQTIARADRVLSNPGGRSLLLIGRSGVGRHTTVKLLSVMHHARIMTPYPGKNYGRKQFISDLKSAMHTAGVDGDMVYFVVEDHHITDQSFYAMIDSLLASGEIPGVYTSEEIEALLAPLKEVAGDEGYRGSLFSFYAQRVRNRLRIIFIMDCAQPSYETLVETHPSMYKYSDPIWMENWSKKSMMAVASRIIPNDERAIRELEKTVQIYESLESSLKCPRRYVSFIHTFASICAKKTARISEHQQRIQTGVSKLSEARELVAHLQAEAGQQERLLEQKQMEAKAALQMITDTIQSAGVKRDEMQDLRSTIATENIALTERKQAIDQELAEIEPLLMEARAAVSEIRNEALSEIRSLRAPPEVIRDILEGVLRLMGILDTSWTSMKSFLAKRGIKEEIRSFDARKITPESRRAVEQLLARRKESFDDKVARRASAAAAPLAAWVHANVSYSRVLERITPLEQEQANLRRNLQSAEDNMTRLATGLDDVDKQVAVLREQLSVSTREASEIEIGLNKARQTLSVSQKLVHELADEYDRWRSQLEELEHNHQYLAIHALLAAAFINFLSCAAEDDRKKSLSRWLEQLHPSEKIIFSLKTFLTNEQELMQWRSEGLAPDDLAVDNALAILQGTMNPHILDSTGKSIQWIATHFKSSTVEITSQGDERFSNVLDLAIRFGKILIVQDVDTIDPILFPILRNDYVVQGVRKLVRLGDKLVDWNDNFQLFLFSRSAGLTPSVSPQANALVNIINFNTTEAGLSEQLVALTVKYENPELEQRKKQLLEQEEQLKLQLAQLEEKLLQTLGNSQGNILENTDVLTSLRQLKQSSATIGQSLKESLELQSSLEKERSTYNELAQFGSRLFFAIRELAKLNSCYQFSVPAFMQIFLKNLDSKNIENGPEKLDFIRQRLLKTVYTMVSRALFKPDKMVAAVHIVREMYPHIFQPNEWELFAGLKGGRPYSNQIQLPSWIDESRVPNVSAIKAILPNVFSALHLDDGALWTKSGTGIPAAVSKGLSPFQQVLVVQAIYPDRLINTLAHFLSRTLELTELFPATSSLRTILNETSSVEPILVLLPGDGSGAYDMTAELDELARDILGENSLIEIAMGTDETEKATESVIEAARNGHWICLKNVHLVSSWLPTLDRLVNELHREEDGSLHENFRLWMTAEPVSTLPVSLLQRSKKIVSEAPQGMKRNLNRTFEAWNPSTLPSVPIHMQALFVLAWFHAVVQERRNYVPQGWLKKHEFSESDLRAAVEVLEQVFREIKDTENRWEYVNGLLLNVIYGGRVDNNFDLRILRSYLVQYFSDDTLGKQQSAIDHEIVVPLSNNLRDYMAVVRRLPETDKSSYFGLPPNIDATVQYNQSLYLSARLKGFYQTSIQSGVGDAKLLLNKLTPIFGVWKTLLQGTSLLNNKDTLASSLLNAKSSPLAAFVIAESALAIRLVNTVHQSLAAMNRSLKSGLALSVSLMESAIEIASMKTPKSWFTLWEGPLQVEQYLRSLVKRARALTEEWLPSALKNQLLSNVLDLSHLMSPEAFFSVHRQHSARELGISMDSLQLSTSWSKPTNRSRTEVTASLNGIYIQGARMTSGIGMEECSEDTPSWNPIPLCYLSWIPADDSGSRTNGLHMVKVPLYVDEERQRLITVLDIPFASGIIDDWYRAGIALSLKD